MLFLKARGQSRYAQSLCLSFSTHMEDVVTAPSPAPGGCTSSDSSVQQPILEIRAPRERIHARITATHVPRDEGPGPQFLDPKAGLIGTQPATLSALGSRRSDEIPRLDSCGRGLVGGSDRQFRWCEGRVWVREPPQATSLHVERPALLVWEGPS